MRTNLYNKHGKIAGYLDINNEIAELRVTDGGLVIRAPLTNFIEQIAMVVELFGDKK